LALLDSDEGLWYTAGGPLLTVLVGAVVNRWWALLAPVAVTVGLVVFLLTEQSDCPTCEQDEFGVVLLLTMLLFTGPAVAALAIGVGLRRVRRRLAPGQQDA
jgi:hypothetical protein